MGSLRFDRDQRYLTLCEVARRLGVHSSHTVLDVGGGTGELGTLLGCEAFWTADPLGGGPRHVCCSMDQIPVADNTFDLVVQADALEHVPRSMRLTSLDEMARVSRKWLIWIGPVDTPAAVEAEEDLCAVHRVLFGGREMDWLIEHRRHGLPQGREVIRALARHFTDWAWWRSCGLREWWSFKRLELQLDVGPYRPLLEEALNNWYSTEGWKTDYHLTGAVPSYRCVFVGCKQGNLPPSIEDPPVCSSLSESGKIIANLAGALAGGVGLGADGHPQAPTAAIQLERIAHLLEAHAPAPDTGFLARWMGR